jgi:hypothetical protein
MGGAVKAWVLAAAATWLGVADARADMLGTQDTNVGTFGDAFARKSHWVVGVTIDRAAGIQRRGFEDLVDDQLFGVTASWYRGWFGLHGQYTGTPHRRLRRSRTIGALGTRFHYTALEREWTYGLNVQVEANLPEHAWFAYATPVELGTDLFVHNTFHMQLFVGARYAFAGAVIENMYIDPNGIHEATFQAAVDDKLDAPWEAYASIVFGRRLW